RGTVASRASSSPSAVRSSATRSGAGSSARPDPWASSRGASWPSSGRSCARPWRRRDPHSDVCVGPGPAEPPASAACWYRNSPVSQQTTDPQGQAADSGLDLARFDRLNTSPAWQVVAESLRRKIALGLYRPGDLLPSERQLAEGMGVSRITVREALRV